MRKLWLAAAAVLFLAVMTHGIFHDVPPAPQAGSGPAGLGMMLEEDAGGVSVLAVQQKSIADRAGVIPGDLLLRANDAPFANISELDRLFGHFAPSGIRLQLMRAGEPVMVQLAFQP